MKKPSKKQIKEAAKTHTMSILGEAQYNNMPDVRKSIINDFEAGANWILDQQAAFDKEVLATLDKF